MAKYNVLPDGSSLIETDDGRQTRTALDAATLENSFGATLDPELQLTRRANDITQRIDDVRAKYDPAYAASREEGKKKDADAAGRLEIDQKAGGLKRQIDEQRAVDLSGATAQNDVKQLDRIGPYGPAGAPRNATDTGGAGPDPVLSQINGQQPAPVRLVPNTAGATGTPSMGSYSDSQKASGGGGDPVLQGLAQLAASQAVTRTRGSKGGWVPTSRSVARDEVPPPEYLEAVDAAEQDVEGVATSAQEEKAKRFNETIVTPQLDQLEQNTAALEAAYQRRQRYDKELADKKKLADDTEKTAAEMKMPNVRDDYFDNNGGVFGRLLAGIAAGAGQWATMAKGGGGANNALAIINDNIKEHGQNLRDKYEQAKDNAKAQNNAYGQMLAQYGDPDAAMEALNLRGETIADRMLKVQMGRHMNAGENAQFDQWLAQRKVDRAARWADVAGKSAGRTMESESYARPTGGGTSVNLKAVELAGKLQKDSMADASNPEGYKQDLAAKGLAIRLDPEDAQRLGTPQLFANNAEQQKEARKALDYYKRGDTAIQRMKEIARTSGWEVNPELRTDMKALGGILKSQLSNPLGLLQQTKEELGEISGPLSVTDSWKLDAQAIRSLTAAENLFKQNKSIYMRSLTRSPFKYDYAEGDVDAKPVRGRQ